MSTGSQPDASSAAVAAIVAAAGRSTRMGAPKQLLPWGENTVLNAVVQNLAHAGAHPLICVVGHESDKVSRAVLAAGTMTDTDAESLATDIEIVFNPDYAAAEMLVSYQTGVRRLLELQPAMPGALFALGDQPHIPVAVIRRIIQHAIARPQAIVIPSFNMRRGHPIYVPQPTWPYLLQLTAQDSLRDLMRKYAELIDYVAVDTDAVLRDMDTPQDYETLKRATLKPDT